MIDCSKKIVNRIRQKFISGVRSEETGGLLNYYTLHVRDKAIAGYIVQNFESKVDAISWIFYPLCFGITILNIANYLSNLPQALVTLFIYSINTVVCGIMWTILCCIPSAKQHTAKVALLFNTIIISVLINLAYRNMLPVKVDMANLELF